MVGSALPRPVGQRILDQQDFSFPDTKPYRTDMLPVGQGHSLYLQESGNPARKPAVFLHGGPGSGCQPAHRRLFDPELFRLVLFDQRGAGRSTPKRGLEANTTQHLVADLEQIREALQIERWMVVGGSWGALLALAYAETHPERVSALVLRGVLLGEREEIDWAFTEGPRIIRPELWQAYRDLLPADERADPVAAYGARLTDPEPQIHVAAARIWHDYERALSVLTPPDGALPASLEAAYRSTSRVPETPFFEWHYIRHGFFLEPGQILDRSGRLGGIPGLIVQGRYDLLCPPLSAYRLAQAWRDCELRPVEGGGHSADEPAVRRALMAAIDSLGRGWT